MPEITDPLVEQEGFEHDYAEKAHHQKSYNSQIIGELVQAILRWFPHARETPISILDLCCGDGGSTHELLQTLTREGVQISRVVGYDISAEQIEVAKTHARRDARLHFGVQDAGKITDQNQFDVVISLFGLHWIGDIKSTANRIHQALKPDGRVMFFVPLEEPELLAFRQAAISSPKWHPRFHDFTLTPFRETASGYTEPFSVFFHPEDEHNIHGRRPKFFPEADFITFLSSWMQEVRHLEQEKRADYVSELVASIPDSPCRNANVTRDAAGNDDGEVNVRFIQRSLWWHGARKEQPAESVTLENTPELTPLQSSLVRGFIGFEDGEDNGQNGTLSTDKSTFVKFRC